MALNFGTTALKNETMLSLRVTEDNFEEVVTSLNGSTEDGVASFKISNHTHYFMVGDWIVLFDRGRDILTFTDKMYQRLFKSV